MKFLCPSCKAKYQIADEKVIGRTVKMKCRQCGFVIEISEALMDLAAASGGRNTIMPPGDASAVGLPAGGPGGAKAAGGSVVGAPHRAAPPKPTRLPTPPSGIPAVSAPGPGAAPRKPPPSNVQNVVPVRSQAPGSVLPRPAGPAPADAAPPSSRPLAERRSHPLAASVPERKSQPIGTAVPERKSQTLAASIADRKSQPLGGAASPERKSRPMGEPVAARSGEPARSIAIDKTNVSGEPPSSARAEPQQQRAQLGRSERTREPAERDVSGQAQVSARHAEVTPEANWSSGASGRDTGPRRGVGRLPGVPDAVASSLGAVASPSADPLAGAFASAVQSAPTEAADHPLAGDEWYVGVGEQPIGPIRLQEIRDRAARGEITPGCLVWRDGLEDWRPLTAFPELVAVVEDGLASARSLAPPSSPVAADPFTLPRVAAAPPQLSGGLGAIGNEPPRVGGAGVQGGRGVAYVPAAAVTGTLDGDALGGAARPAANAALLSHDDALEVAGLTKTKIPLSAWAAVVMALVLGVTIGIVLIKPTPQQPIIKYVTVPANPSNTPANTPAGNTPEPFAAADQGNEAADAKQPSGAAPRRASGSGTAAAAVDPGAASSAAAPQGLKGLAGLRGLGPQGSPQPNGAGVASGASQLDSATLSKTVSRYTPSVKRSCWQPALDMRTPDAPTTARVTAMISVGPSGRVQNVSTSGDPKGYRGLATCIQSRVRNWEFPPAGGTTEVNVPFVFAAQ